MNKILRFFNLVRYKSYFKLLKENKQLKKERKQLSDSLLNSIMVGSQLYNETCELKNQIELLYEVIGE